MKYLYKENMLMQEKLQLREILNINQTLKTIIDDKQANIDVLLKFKLLGIMKAIEPTISNYNIICNEKIIEYGEKTKKGNYQISLTNKECINKFNADIEKVLNSEIIVNIEKLKAIEVFNKGVKAEYLIGLYSIIE